MKIKTHACDNCGVHQKDATHWWLILQLKSARGIIIVEWDNNLWEAGHISQATVNDKSTHICGATCVTEWLSKNLL